MQIKDVDAVRNFDRLFTFKCRQSNLSKLFPLDSIVYTFCIGIYCGKFIIREAEPVHM